jgi:hypothetical protein
VHHYVTVWHYTIDPTILAVSAKTWRSFSPEDQQILQEVGNVVMAEQKKEARDGLEDAMVAIDILEKMYQMEVANLSPSEVEAFRYKTRLSTTGGRAKLGSIWSVARRALLRAQNKAGDVRFWPLADTPSSTAHVRFRGKSRHGVLRNFAFGHC